MENPLQRDLDHVLEKTEDLWRSARGARFMLTGGTGFVGTWLTESLLWANRRLELGLSATLLTRNPARLPDRAPAVTLLQGDATSFEMPAGPFDFAIPAAPERQPVLDRDLEATRRMLELALHRGVRRFLFTSSGAVYGTQPPAISHVT